jgi:hypothetical protein
MWILASLDEGDIIEERVFATAGQIETGGLNGHEIVSCGTFVYTTHLNFILL